MASHSYNNFTNTTLRRFASRDELKAAVQEWEDNAESREHVTSLYGHISNWNVSGVTSLESLFYVCPAKRSCSGSGYERGKTLPDERPACPGRVTGLSMMILTHGMSLR